MKHLYERLADLLEYPGEDWSVRLEVCKQQVMAESSDTVSDFQAFCQKVKGLSVIDLQELYTRTFDLSPVCTLEIGYHLFGENYKRGELLAHLRETEAPYGLGQERQLPDYLPVLLRLLVRLDEGELRSDLISELMSPAVGKMREALTGADNPYGDLMGLIYRILTLESPVREVAHAPAGWERAATMARFDRFSSRVMKV